MRKTALLLALALPLLAAGQQRDWTNYGRYAEANAALTTAPAVVFMGNSITDGWDNAHPEFFTDNNFACRGISGQVTSQMLCRFRADVIALRPKAVVILAGTNDIAGNNGPIECEHIVENIVSMAELALAAGIRPILCSVLPAAKYPWRPEIESVPEKIAALNARTACTPRPKDTRSWRASSAPRWRSGCPDRRTCSRQTEKSPPGGDFFVPGIVFPEYFVYL